MRVRSLLRIVVVAVGIGAAASVRAEEPPSDAAPEVKEADIRTSLAEGDRLLFAGDAAAARDPYEHALTLLPRDQHPQVLKQLARIDYEAGDRRGAVDRLEAVLEIAPEDPDAIRLMVSLLAEQGRVGDAQAYAKRLPKRVPLDANASMNLGFALQSRGDLRGAHAQFARAIREHPGTVDAYYYRSQTALALGDRATALADSQKLVALAPGHPKAAEARALIGSLSRP
jgi:tetratricopeptide (TPR) repeat protein